MLDLLLVLLAVVCAFPMVYGVWAGRKRAQGADVPSTGAMLRAAWAVAGPVLALLGYGLKRLLAYNWQPSEDEKPPLLRRERVEYVNYAAFEEADEPQTDQTDPVSALPNAVGALEVDRTRMGVIRALVAMGWETGHIRAVLKGDNGTIGQEVAQARAELDAPSARTVLVRHRAGGAVREQLVPME